MILLCDSLKTLLAQNKYPHNTDWNKDYKVENTRREKLESGNIPIINYSTNYKNGVAAAENNYTNPGIYEILKTYA